MKKFSYIAILALCTVVISDTTEARSKRTVSAKTETPITSHMVDPAAGESSSGGLTYGLGVSTLSPIPFSSNILTFGSVTGIFAFSSANLVQWFASIPDTENTFKFGVGGLFKHTLFGNNREGFHLGGGLGIGTTGNFAMNLSGVVGIHYLFGSHMALHVDGGPVLSIRKVDTGSTTDTHTSLSLGQYSSVLGASLIYMF